MRIMLKSKIHRAHVTDCNIDYEGSITIDRTLMEEADILPYEQVQVLDINNGSRFTTYAIEGGPREICVNGAAARLVSVGDLVIILSYCHLRDDEARTFRPTLVHVDANNVSTSVRRATETAPV
jgi:aspartate 1-decarboxylase